MTITGVVIRRRVVDLDAALSFYEQLTGESANRFAFSGAELAAVGPFLLFTAPDDVGDRLARVVATLVVDDLDAEQEALVALGADVVAARAEAPNGRRLIVRHPDGAVFDYAGKVTGQGSSYDRRDGMNAGTLHPGICEDLWRTSSIGPHDSTVLGSATCYYRPLDRR